MMIKKILLTLIGSIALFAQNLKDSDFEVVTIKAGVSTAKVGHFVTGNGETAPNVDLAVTTDGTFRGIIVRPVTIPDSWDIDTAFAAGTDVVILKPTGGRCVVAGFLEATAGPVPVVPGDKLALGTGAGKVRKWSYADAAMATDTLSEVVGTAAESDGGSAADDHVILINY
jgi:hypothetical protein